MAEFHQLYEKLLKASRTPQCGGEI